MTADDANGLSRKLAVVCDARNKDYFADLDDELDALKRKGIPFRIVFLDADDDKLVARYKASRRRHPLCDEGMTIAQGITAERALLYQLRVMAQDVVNTTDMLPMQLRAKIRELFGERRMSGKALPLPCIPSVSSMAPRLMPISLSTRVSFPNPYYDPALKSLTGLDATVRDFVMYRDETVEFMSHWKSLLDRVMPGYVKEGKQQLAIAVGCTGGQHRSVAIAEATGDYLRTRGYRVSVTHRDLPLAESVQNELTGEAKVHV